MDKNESLLLQKFISSEINGDSKLKDIYKTIISSNVVFSDLITSLKNDIEYSYDFKVLTSESKVLGSNRKDIRSLLDIFADMLGGRITDLCEKVVITQPSKFEDYCPFPNAELVAYGSSHTNFIETDIIVYDGSKYRIVNSKMEITPYYSIKCAELERI